MSNSPEKNRGKKGSYNQETGEGTTQEIQKKTRGCRPTCAPAPGGGGSTGWERNGKNKRVEGVPATRLVTGGEGGSRRAQSAAKFAKHS